MTNGSSLKGLTSGESKRKEVIDDNVGRQSKSIKINGGYHG